VSIYGIDAQGKRRKAATALLEWTGIVWVIADLLEDNSSLLKILDDLERDRQNWAEEAAKSKKKD
jgi:flagellar biosynthesis/type III secretory pathway chaperone